MAGKDIDSLKEELERVKSQIHSFEEENKALENLLKENRVGHMDKYAKVLQVAVYVIVLIVGIGVSWGVMSSRLASVEKTNEQVAALETRVRQLEIKESGSSEILNSIRSDVSDIKTELRKLTKGQ